MRVKNKTEKVKRKKKMRRARAATEDKKQILEKRKTMDKKR